MIITLIGGLWIISQAPKVNRSNSFIRQRQRFPGQARPFASPLRPLLTASYQSGASSSRLVTLANANINRESDMWNLFNNAEAKIMEAFSTQYVTQPIINLSPCFKEWVRPPGKVNFPGDEDGSTGKALIVWAAQTGTLDAIKKIKTDEKLTDSEKDQRINGLISSFCNDLIKISSTDIKGFQKKIEDWVNKIFTDFVPPQPQPKTEATTTPTTTAAAATTTTTTATVAVAPAAAPATPAAPKDPIPASIVAKGPLKLGSSGEEVRQLNDLLVKMGLPATEELKKDIEKNSTIPKYSINYTKATEKAVSQLQAFLMQEAKKKGKNAPAALQELTKVTKGKPTGSFGKVTRDAWNIWLTDYLKAQAEKKK